MIHASMSFDGGVRGGNPGHAGFAAVIVLSEFGDERIIARPIRGRHTNNYAEYMGLIVGAKYAHHLGVQRIDIVSDSKLVVEQVNGNWRIDSPVMCKLCWEAQDLLERHFSGYWKLSWVPRLQNTVADAACAQAVRCSVNPWIPNRLDPFAPNKALVTLSRVRTQAPTRA
jgi:ribonuclease HI